MATANFPAVNTSKIYAFGFNVYFDAEAIEANDLPADLLGQYDEDGTNWAYEMARDSAADMLQRKGWGDGGRDAIADKTRSLTVAGVEVEITLEARVYGGYYEGAVFDIEPTIKVWDRDGCYLGEYSEIDADSIVTDNWCANVGLSKIQARNIERKVLAELQVLTDEAEAVFQECSEYRLACVGRCSNGEAFYMDLERETAEAVSAETANVEAEKKVA